MEYSETALPGSADGEAAARMTDRLNEWDSVDPGSMTFRYATDKDRQQFNLPDRWTVDLDTLREVVGTMWTYVEACHSWADDCLQSKREYEAEFEYVY